jgi:hypothetical protein
MNRKTGRREVCGLVLPGFPSSRVLLAVLVAGCGYQPLYAANEGAKLHVHLSRSLVPDAAASDEVVSGAREQLAREGALAPGDGWPRVEIEVLRIDETSDAVSAPRGQNAPLARGTEVALVARAWIAPSPGAPPEHDTGDVSAHDLVGRSDVARADLFAHEDAARAVARRVGQRLALKVLGHPIVAEE